MSHSTYRVCTVRTTKTHNKTCLTVKFTLPSNALRGDEERIGTLQAAADASFYVEHHRDMTEEAARRFIEGGSHNLARHQVAYP